MLSRVAENLYWMARYMSVPNTARLLSVNTHLMLDLPRHLPLGWAPLIEDRDAGCPARHTGFDERSVMHFVRDAENGSSILSALAAPGKPAHHADVVPREKRSAALSQRGGSRGERREPSASGCILKNVIRGCQTLTGLIEHLEPAARTFIKLGRRWSGRT